MGDKNVSTSISEFHIYCSIIIKDCVFLFLKNSKKEKKEMNVEQLDSIFTAPPKAC